MFKNGNRKNGKSLFGTFMGDLIKEGVGKLNKLYGLGTNSGEMCTPCTVIISWSLGHIFLSCSC